MGNISEDEARKLEGRIYERIGSRGQGSLMLESKSTGAVFAYYRERTKNGDKRVKIGSLKKTRQSMPGELTLAQIRAKARELAALCSEHGGIAGYLSKIESDKAQLIADQKERKLREEIASQRGTFADLLDSYVSHMESKGKTSAGKVKSLFRVNIQQLRPDLAKMYADELTPEHITSLLSDVLSRKPVARGIGNKAKPPDSNMRSTTDELRRYIRTAFNHAAASHLAVGLKSETLKKKFSISSNPAALIPPLEDASGGNTESLQPSELAELLRHIDTLTDPKRSVAKALIYLGGQRIKQLLAVEWEDITSESITLLDAKGKKVEAWEHLLPLTPRISEIISPLLERDRYKDDCERPFPLHKDTLSKIFTDASNTLTASGKTSPFSWQRVRATCETLLAANGVSVDVRGWLLSHGRTGVQAKHYDRNAYMPEKTSALIRWGEYLDELALGKFKPDTRTVVMTKRRAISRSSGD